MTELTKGFVLVTLWRHGVELELKVYGAVVRNQESIGEQVKQMIMLWIAPIFAMQPSKP